MDKLNLPTEVNRILFKKNEKNRCNKLIVYTVTEKIPTLSFLLNF